MHAVQRTATEIAVNGTALLLGRARPRMEPGAPRAEGAGAVRPDGGPSPLL
jgi:hypothetical protein